MTITETALPGSSLDPLMLVYNIAGILVASGDDSTGSQTCQVQFSVVPGQVDKVICAGLGLSMGRYQLSISTADSNDSGSRKPKP